MFFEDLGPLENRLHESFEHRTFVSKLDPLHNPINNHPRI